MADEPGSPFKKFTLLAYAIDPPMTNPEVRASHPIGAARYQKNVGRDGAVSDALHARAEQGTEYSPSCPPFGFLRGIVPAQRSFDPGRREQAFLDHLWVDGVETLDIEDMFARGDLQPSPSCAGQIRKHQQPRCEPIEVALAELALLLVGPVLAQQTGGQAPWRRAAKPSRARPRSGAVCHGALEPIVYWWHVGPSGPFVAGYGELRGRHDDPRRMRGHKISAFEIDAGLQQRKRGTVSVIE